MSFVFLGALEDSLFAWEFCCKKRSSDFTTGCPLCRQGGKHIRVQLQASVPWTECGGPGSKPSAAHAAPQHLEWTFAAWWLSPEEKYLLYTYFTVMNKVDQCNIDAGLQTGILKLFSYTDVFHTTSRRLDLACLLVLSGPALCFHPAAVLSFLPPGSCQCTCARVQRVWQVALQEQKNSIWISLTPLHYRIIIAWL